MGDIIQFPKSDQSELWSLVTKAMEELGVSKEVAEWFATEYEQIQKKAGSFEISCKLPQNKDDLEKIVHETAEKMRLSYTSPILEILVRLYNAEHP